MIIKSILRQPPDDFVSVGKLFEQIKARSIEPHLIRTYLKKKSFVSDQGEAKHQPAGILVYFEDLMRGFNADMEQKDFFEIGSSVPYSIKGLSPIGLNIQAGFNCYALLFASFCRLKRNCPVAETECNFDNCYKPSG